MTTIAELLLIVAVLLAALVATIFDAEARPVEFILVGGLLLIAGLLTGQTIKARKTRAG